MNKLGLTLPGLIVFCLLTLMPPRTNAAIDGFRGMRWGDSLEQIQSTRILVQTKENSAEGSALYSVENEELDYGEAKLSGIHCNFLHGKLYSVLLLLKDSKNFTALKAEAFAEFGKTKGEQQGNEELFQWTRDSSDIVLSYNRETQEGFLFLKQRAPQVQPALPTPPTPAMTPAPPASSPPTPRPPEPSPLPPSPAVASPPAVSAPVPGPLAQGPDRGQPAAAARHLDQAFAPEIQRLIDRDLELTGICWDGVGREHEEACRQMRLNGQRLLDLGLCMTPRPADMAGPDFVWSQCQPPVAPEERVSDEKNDAICHLIGGMFESTAQLRNEGAPPETAERMLTAYQIEWAPEITRERIRETVALVYFNPDYARAWGRRLHQQMYQKCMTAKGAQPPPPR